MGLFSRTPRFVDNETALERLNARIDGHAAHEGEQTALRACAWAGVVALGSVTHENGWDAQANLALRTALARTQEAQDRARLAAIWVMITQAYTAGDPAWERSLASARAVLEISDAQFAEVIDLGHLFSTGAEGEDAQAAMARRFAAATLDLISRWACGAPLADTPDRDALLAVWQRRMVDTVIERNRRLVPRQP